MLLPDTSKSVLTRSMCKSGIRKSSNLRSGSGGLQDPGQVVQFRCTQLALLQNRDKNICLIGIVSVWINTSFF